MRCGAKTPPIKRTHSGFTFHDSRRCWSRNERGAERAQFFSRQACDGTLTVIETVGELFNAYPVNPSHADLLADMNSALADMIEDGTYEETYSEWFDTPEFRVDQP